MYYSKESPKLQTAITFEVSLNVQIPLKVLAYYNSNNGLRSSNVNEIVALCYGRWYQILMVSG